MAQGKFCYTDIRNWGVTETSVCSKCKHFTDKYFETGAVGLQHGAHFLMDTSRFLNLFLTFVFQGEKSFFLLPGEKLEQGIQDVFILGEDEGLILKANEAFLDVDEKEVNKILFISEMYFFYKTIKLFLSWLFRNGGNIPYQKSRSVYSLLQICWCIFCRSANSVQII